MQHFVQWHFKNPIWPPRLHEINKMVITPSVFVREMHLDAMTIGIVRGVRGTRRLMNFQKKSNMAVATP